MGASHRFAAAGIGVFGLERRYSSRDSLCADEEGDAASNSLSITVLRLRKLLGSSDAVVQKGGKVWLNPELCWVDAWAFEDRIACY